MQIGIRDEAGSDAGPVFLIATLRANGDTWLRR